MIQGANFQPGSAPSAGADPRRRAAQGLQEAIRVLSLRMPKVVGAQSLAPAPLLQGSGSGGDPRIDSVMQQVMGRMLPTAPPPDQGVAPGVPPVIGPGGDASGPLPVAPGPEPGGTSGTMPVSPPVRFEPPPSQPLASFLPPAGPRAATTRITAGFEDTAPAGPLPPETPLVESSMDLGRDEGEEMAEWLRRKNAAEPDRGGGGGIGHRFEAF